MPDDTTQARGGERWKRDRDRVHAARDLVRLYGTMTAGPVRFRFAVTFRPPRRVLDDDGWPLPDFKRAIVALLPLDRLELKTDLEALDALMAMDRRTPVRFSVDRVAADPSPWLRAAARRAPPISDQR
ncbi:hypothetical protein HY633_01445 [Candidatus Uhrbacteria bacterium]|nr:hypothetical protein [Candidatus Uhrbacteria bacterium]